MIKMFFATFLFFAAAFNGQTDEPKKYTLSICTLFKNEAPYLKEWIEYHRLIGVDHFYLYNNESLDPFRKVLAPYIRNEIVTLVQWPDWIGQKPSDDTTWIFAVQIPAYEHAAKWKAIKDTEWLIFLDIDEFLVPCANTTLADLLQEYEEYPGIILKSEYYDASIRGVLPPRKLVIEATEITSPPTPTLKRAVEKTIFKPELCMAITWPPYRCLYKDDMKPITLSKKTIRINRYENRMRFQRVEKVKRKVEVDKANLSERDQADLFKLNYQIEDSERAIYKFVPEVYKKMGLSIGK